MDAIDDSLVGSQLQALTKEVQGLRVIMGFREAVAAHTGVAAVSYGLLVVGLLSTDMINLQAPGSSAGAEQTSGPLFNVTQRRNRRRRTKRAKDLIDSSIDSASRAEPFHEVDDETARFPLEAATKSALKGVPRSGRHVVVEAPQRAVPVREAGFPKKPADKVGARAGGMWKHFGTGQASAPVPRNTAGGSGFPTKPSPSSGAAWTRAKKRTTTSLGNMAPATKKPKDTGTMPKLYSRKVRYKRVAVVPSYYPETRLSQKECDYIKNHILQKLGEIEEGTSVTEWVVVLSPAPMIQHWSGLLHSAILTQQVKVLLS